MTHSKAGRTPLQTIAVNEKILPYLTEAEKLLQEAVHIANAAQHRDLAALVQYRLTALHKLVRTLEMITLDEKAKLMFKR